MPEQFRNSILLCLISAFSPLQIFWCVSPAVGEESGTIILTEEDISAAMAHSMADVLNTIPGVSAGKTSVSIHGSSKVKVFIDGRPLNDPTSSHGGIKWDLARPDQVAKIEVLLGRGGVRYGRDASGGVILISSKSTEKLSIDGKTWLGSDNTFYANGSLQQTNEKLSTGVSGSYESTDGYTVNKDKTTWSGEAAFEYRFHEKARISLSGNHMESDRGSSGRVDYPTPFLRLQSIMSTLTVQGNLNNVETKFSYNRAKRQSLDPSRSLDKTLRVEDFDQEISSFLETPKWGIFQYGASCSLNRASGSSFDKQSENSFSAHVMNNLTMDNLPLTTVFGLRANIHSAFDNNLNPEIKFIYGSDGLRTTLAYSRNNNSPSFYQRYNETSSTRPNPDLDMEIADNFRLSFSSEITSEIRASVNLFYNLLTDRITYVVADDGIGQYENLGEVHYSGSDFSVDWKVLDAMKIKARYTYLQAVDEESGNLLPAKPEHKGRIDISYTVTENLSVKCILRTASKAYRNRENTNYVSGYEVLDFKVEYGFERYSLFGEINNITDETYCYADGLLAPPRTWFVGLSMSLQK